MVFDLLGIVHAHTLEAQTLRNDLNSNARAIRASALHATAPLILMFLWSVMHIGDWENCFDTSMAVLLFFFLVW